jgi:hypothetical protein
MERLESGYSVSEAPQEDWDALVVRFPRYTVFHTLAWLRSLQEAHGLELTLLQARKSNDCVAVWPCLSVWKGPIRVVGSPLPGWSTVYLGPLVAPGVEPIGVLSALLNHPPLSHAGFMYSKILDEDRPIDMSALGFDRLHRFHTYIVPLVHSEEELWSRLAKRCRKAIRKAQNIGLTVRREADTHFLDDFWRMSIEIFARSNLKPVYTRKLVERVVDNLGRDGRLLVMSVFYEGRRVSTQILPYDDHTVYGWAAASFADYRPLSTSNILDWETILEARRMGLRAYDMVSVYGGPGVYKRSFGPEEHAVATHWERSRSRLIGYMKKAYESYSRRRLKTG